MSGQPIILFDGVCNFCNSAVNFVIKRDKKSVLRFATLQSNYAHELLAQYSLPANDVKSFVFVVDNKLYTRSAAALHVFRHLGGGWPLMYGFIIVPGFIRDAIYSLISKKRYQWFGKKETCMVPAPDVKARFLNE